MLLVAFIIEVLLLTISLSIDTFISGLAYGSNKIKVPFSSIILINIICSAILGISLLGGSFISKYVSPNLTTGICVTILIILGLMKIFDSFIKNLIRKHNGLDKNIKITLLSLKLTLNLYAAPEESDFDNSKLITAKEAIAIAIALSIDSLTIGFGTGLVNITLLKGLVLTFVCFIMGLFALVFGCSIGNKIAYKINSNITWVSGLLLITLAIIKIIS